MRHYAAVALDPRRGIGFTAGMSRVPTSLLLLIDRRNRLAGELEKLATLKRTAATLYRDVKKNLAGVDAALAQHSIKLDADILVPQKNYVCGRGRHGSITRSIIQAIKSAGNTPITATEIRTWIETHRPDLGVRYEGSANYTRALSRQLRRLRDMGVVLSPHAGNGATSRTTWIINPDYLGEEA